MFPTNSEEEDQKYVDIPWSLSICKIQNLTRMYEEISEISGSDCENK